MPGISNRGPVSAHDGFGKVHFKFREVRRRHWSVYVLGLFLYTSFCVAMFFTFGWHRPWIRDSILVPIARKLYHGAENLILSKFGIGENVNFIPAIDTNGVAFISGKTISDALVNQGYIHAFNRFAQMDLYRRAAQGRLSELNGINTVELDKLSLKLDFMNLAHKDLVQLSKIDLDILRSYSEGVNKYVTDLSHSWSSAPIGLTMLYGNWTNFRPIDVPQWQPVDTLAVMRLMAYEWSSGWERSIVHQLLSASPSSGEEEDFDFAEHSAIPSLGGNAFVVTGKHTASGGPILVSDAHSKVSYHVMRGMLLLKSVSGQSLRFLVPKQR